MKLYLSVQPTDLVELPILNQSKYLLGSYYYFKDSNDIDFSKFNDFILDSGAFTFLNSQKEELSLGDYWKFAKEYADFIIKHNIKKYIELDLDSVVGYEEVLKIRKYLESRTERKCIPVWHISRGKEEFIKMCKEYELGAIGGIVTKEPIVKYKHTFKHLNLLANRYDCKIHGLGFTPLKNTLDYGFYSSDSTTWTAGVRFGRLYKFNGTTLDAFTKEQLGVKKRMGEAKRVDNYNVREWIKWQDYLESR